MAAADSAGPVMRRLLLGLLLFVALGCAPAGAAAAQEAGVLPERWARFTPENSGLADARVLDIVEAADGSMWFVHPDAVSRFDAQHWQVFSSDVTLPDDVSAEVDDAPIPPWNAVHDAAPARVYRVVRDTRGALWFATDAGALRLAPDRWENGIPAFRGMALYQVRDVLRDSYGVLWFAGYDPVSGEGSLSGLDPSGRWLFFNAEVEPLVSNQVVALAEDAAGGLWAGSLRDGVSRYLGDTWQSWTAADSPLPDDRIIGLQPVADGRVMVVTTRGGVARYDIVADALSLWFPPPVEVFRSALVGADGSLWYAGDWRGGYVLGGVNAMGLHEPGLPITTPALVRSIAQRETDGSLWAATCDVLLHRPAGAPWPAWVEVDLPHAEKDRLGFDPGGMLWLSTSDGLVRYDPDTGAWLLFTSQNSRLAEHQAHLAHIEDNGLLVFGSDRVYTSTYRPDAPRRPSILRVDEEDVPAPAQLAYVGSAAAGGSTLRFAVNTASWWPADALRYRARLLLGEETVMREFRPGEDAAAQQAQFVFSGLEAGKYTFCVSVSTPLLDNSAESCAQATVP